MQSSLLIVDDDAHLREIIRLRLEQNGHQVTETSEGDRALELIRNTPIDLVLLDVQLGEIDGLDVLQEIRQIYSASELPVIMVTGKNESEHIIEALNLGSNDYVTKPIDFPVALARIQTHLSLKQAESGLRKAHDNLELRVQERTAELQKTNEALQAEIRGRQQAQGALQAVEFRYHDLIENANDIIYTHDREGNFTSINQAGERIIGYSRGEILKMNIRQFVAPSHQDVVCQMITGILEGHKQRSSYQLTIIANQQREVILDVSIGLIHSEGKPVGLEAIARDVTERIRLEERLRQSQKMEAIGRLAGGVAHDFNNLLTAITGYSELLLEGLGRENPMAAEVEEIRKAADRAGALTHQLLAFSRRQVLQPKLLDLNHVVGNMQKMIRRLIGEDIEIETDFGTGLAPVKADPNQLEQVVLNLAVNSRDAMPHGGKLSFKTQNISIDESSQGAVGVGSYVLLEVADTGCGIGDEATHLIFEPFYTTKEKGRGTGLGLSTVYGIVKQSGGSIYVDSQVGRGTTFKIYFPQVQESIHALEPLLEPNPTKGGSETVLLVEDEAIVRNLVRDTLQKFGYQVLEANHGGDALRLALQYQGPIHLLLTDLVMPQLGGRLLAQQLRPLQPTIRVVYMSGYSGDANIQQTMLDPDTAFIQKPFTPEALARKLREVLDS